MNETLPPALLAALSEGAAGEAGRRLVDELARALTHDQNANPSALVEAAAHPARREETRAWVGRVVDLLSTDLGIARTVAEAMQRHTPGSVGAWYQGDHIDFRGSVFLGDVVGTQVVLQQNGNAGPSRWMKPDDYLREANKGSVYSHRWRLVGRTETMDRLVPFARSAHGAIALLVGRGGVGKTKIVTALCQTLSEAEPAVEVRVLGADSDISSGMFGELPNEGSLLVVIDDAHNDTLPLEKIVSGVRSANPSANVLLCLRPYGLAHARRALSCAGTHMSDTTQVEIGDLEFEDAVSLAGEILKEEVRLHAPRLATSARDCPLLIVTGAALINNGELDPRRFEGDEQLHRELTDRLAEALTTAPSAGQVPRELLSALAAFQPVRLAEPEVQGSLEALTGLPYDVSAPHLEALEEAGVILRHGTTIRLVPDLLGDALLVKAALHRSTGLPTGYLAKAMEAAEGSALANLVVNTGRVDWQQGQGAGAGVLIEPLWQGITATFHSADARGRVSLLEMVKEVAFYQPQRTIDLANWAVEDPSDSVTGDVGFGMMHTWTNTAVHHALADVLQAAARSLESLPQAAALLWRLGCDDQRPLNQYPSHPLRILEKLADYTRWGPTKYQHALVSQVERWLARSPDTATIHQPLSVLSPLLETEGYDELWTPATWSLTFRPYVLAPTSGVLNLRGLVLDLAFEELGHPQLVRASAASSLIGKAFRLPHGTFNLSVTDAMRQPWFPHLGSTIERLHQFILQRTLPPSILVAVRTEVHWLARYGPDDLRQHAQDLLSSIPTSPDNELARALHGGPADPTVHPNRSDWHAAQDSLFQDVMAKLSDWTDDQIATRVNVLLSENEVVFGPDTGKSRQFIWIIVINRPAVGEAICEQAMAAPDRVPASLVEVALAAMGSAAGDRAVHWGRTLMGSKNTGLTRSVALAFGVQRGRDELLGGEGELLRALAAHEDTVVRRATVGAVHLIATQHKDLAIELLTASPVVETADLDAFAMAISGPPFSALSWSDLSQDQQKAFLTALATASSIDSHEVGRFLAELVSTEPLTVIELLEDRIDSSPRQGRGYSPLPFQWNDTPPFRGHNDFPALLRQVRDWIAADPDSTYRRCLGADLFELVAGPYDAQVTEVIEEYFHDGDLVKVTIAADILSKANRTIVWDIDFVRRCLRAADRHGDASLERVRGALHAAAITGMRSGTPGQPYPEDVEQHAKATELADSSAGGSVEEQFYRDLAGSALRLMQRYTDDLPPDGRAW
ncbi:hypothetical protein [Streptomyces microflavus]|uniref:hypothetical protein n=1 Tax=Streptomyces microflavus TaxID=1919 RepID=UPI0036553645